jgi:hypothetical protein
MKVTFHSDLNAQEVFEHKELETTSFGVVHCRVPTPRNLQGEKLLKFHCPVRNYHFLFKTCF